MAENPPCLLVSSGRTGTFPHKNKETSSLTGGSFVLEAAHYSAIKLADFVPCDRILQNANSESEPNRKSKFILLQFPTSRSAALF